MTPGVVLKNMQLAILISSLRPSTDVSWGFLGGSTLKNLPAMWETKKKHVPSLDREDPLGEEMATHSSILAWKIPWTEPGGLQSMGSQRVGLN